MKGISEENFNSAMEIIDFVAQKTETTPKAILGKSRIAEIVEIRYIAIWLMKNEANISFNQMYMLFDRCNHTAMLYAYNKIENLQSIYPYFRKRIQEMQLILKLKKLNNKIMQEFETTLKVNKNNIGAILAGYALEYKNNPEKKADIANEIFDLLSAIQKKGVDINQNPFKSYMEMITN